MKLTMATINGIVAVCTGCNHWQIDAAGRASRLGTYARDVMLLLAQAHAEHLPDCPGGTTGRVKVGREWIERPDMGDGRKADGVLGVYPLPPWWVWR